MGQWLSNINADASPYATTQAIIALRDLDLRPALSKIKVPVAIFHGTKDKLCDFVFAEQLQKGIKRWDSPSHKLGSKFARLQASITYEVDDA